MKRVLLLMGIVVVVVVLGTATWWGYQYTQYRQHWPAIDLVVNDVLREYHIYMPRSKPGDRLALLVLLQGGDAGSWRFAQQARWEALADERGIVLAQPVGKKLKHNEGCVAVGFACGCHAGYRFYARHDRYHRGESRNQ